MKKLIALFTMILATASAQAESVGGHDGNGGAGVLKNGSYMTFYTAGLYVEPSESPVADIPGLNSLIRYITSLNYLGFDSKGSLLLAINPTDKRQYFIAEPSSLTADVMARLKAEFQRVTHVNPATIVLYALTDTNTGTTFILPPFMHLSLNDQMAILFHESYWVMHPDTSYNNVVSAEMAFEAALESPNDAARVFDFARKVGSSSDSFAAAVQWDASAGSLNGLLHYDKGGYYLNVADLIDSATFNCLQKEEPALTGDEYDYARPCVPFFSSSVNQLIQRFPKSAVMRTIGRFAGDSSDSIGHRPDTIFYSAPSISSWSEINKCKVYLQDVSGICPVICQGSRHQGGMDLSDY